MKKILLKMCFLPLICSKQLLDKTGTDKNIKKETAVKDYGNVCECPELYEPVCGTDGKEYGNACFARCENVKVNCKGQCPCKKKCDRMKNRNTECLGNGNCTMVFVKKTSNVVECINICKEREKCRHYIWHYTDAPTTTQDEECWVVDVEEGQDDWTHRTKSINAVTGSCNTECRCNFHHRQICGVDGKTYTDICMAKCEGIKMDCDGNCPCKGCRCESTYAPVCGENGKTYANMCTARCEGVKTKCATRCPCKRKIFCFASTSTVETREGVKTIAELRIGDEIRTSADNLDNIGDEIRTSADNLDNIGDGIRTSDNTRFTEFLGWLDRHQSTNVEMLQLFTDDNSPAVTLSASHVVFTNNSTMYAGDLVPGDTLLHWDGVQMKELVITEIRTSQESGFWAPLTRSGTLLVNGFLMSCYASYPHKLADVAMTPIKAMSKTLLDDEESQHKDGVRKAVSFMKSLGQLFGARRGEEVFEKFPMNWAALYIL